MRLNRRARVLRTAAVATGTSAALLLPAAAAFATEDPAGPADPAAAASDRSVLWRNVDLADGSLAKVYRDGPGRFSADVYGGGQLLGTLSSTDGKPAYGENNGLHLVLRPDGTVSSWLDRVPAPEPKPVPHREPEAKLADGTVATFAKNVKDGPRVRIAALDGERLATVDAKHLTVRHHGWTYKLAAQPGEHQYRFVVIGAPKQGGDSWVYDLNGRLVAQYHAQKR
ncbi:hypothetical protein AB0E83_01445 [Streptomyces sp. NPDC035033]|uniref:hypothetical protein n=1 Tax=Streptomyces sp. NPDC035033 TaxID=3155368 RepID=UPI0034052410